MPLNHQSLPLTPDPESVRQARLWVGDVLARLGRHDLVDAAELGVSELVTNAILHADPPIIVRVRGTRAHPRIEVRDNSKHPPEVNIEMTDEDNLLSTIGRGLGIVALYSSTWGSELVADGKTVWFEPHTEIRTDGDLSGQVFDFDEMVEQRVARAEKPDELITVRLLDMPVQLFAWFRTRYGELARELRLLALAHGDDYPVATELSELFLQVEQERRHAHGVSELDQAIADNLDRVDLEYHIPSTSPASMARLLELLEKADDFCRDEKLLSLAASPQQMALQRWYLGEFAQQAAGEEPTPWSGGFVVEDADHPIE